MSWLVLAVTSTLPIAITSSDSTSVRAGNGRLSYPAEFGFCEPFVLIGLDILKHLSEDLDLMLSPTKRFCSCYSSSPSLITAQLYAKASSNMYHFAEKLQD